MSELKLEVGKKYVDKIGGIIRIIHFDKLHSLYVGHERKNNDYSTYTSDGVAMPYNGYNDDLISVASLAKEYEEPKTINGEFVVYKSNEGYIIYDNDSNPIDARRVGSMMGTAMKIGTIRLNNIEIEEV